MTLAAVEGQPRAVEALRSALRSDQVHHAYLFGGPEGVGKERTAVALAQALLCQAAPLEGCGACATCTRVERRTHPDVTWVMPEAEAVERGLAGKSDFTGTPSRELKVEQVRGLQERLALRPLEGKRKIAVLVSAEQMNPQAQNAFLKTLEEPPSDTLLVLLASAPDRMLPTIRSRCSKVHFAPLPVELVAARVQAARKVDAATARLVAVMAGGSLGRALAWDVKGLERRAEVVRRFEEAARGGVRPLLRFAEEFGASRQDAEDALAVLQLWTRDVALARAGAGELANADLEGLAREVAARLGEEALHRRHALLERALTSITTRNASARLQLERMLVELGEAA
jgi:DNA polymerase-3 subunit delta'